MATITRQLERQPQDSTSAESRREAGWVPTSWRFARRVGWVAWFTLAAALVLLTIFTHQTALVPQLRDYHANWHGARWIAVSGSNAPVQYFRKDFSLEAAPDSAFLTIQANQYYTVFVNGTDLDTTASDFKSGILYDTNIYDIAPLLRAGANAIAIRAVNQDVGAPQIRAVIGINYGSFQEVFPSDNTWKATDNSLLTQPYLNPSSPNWGSVNFNDAAWQGAGNFTGTPIPDGLVPFDPITFETPMPTTWLTAGPYPGAFFVHTVSLPAYRKVWLRIASTGTSVVYINGNSVLTQPVQMQLDQTGTAPPNAVQYTAGVYDISTYVHGGGNTFAVHVASAGINLISQTQTQPAAMVLDIIVIDPDGTMQQIPADTGWQASPTSVSSWATGGGTTLWQSASPVSQSTITTTPLYKIALPAVQAVADELGTNFNAPNLQQISFRSTVFVFGITALALAVFLALGAAILRSRFVRMGSEQPGEDALRAVALALAPGTAFLGLLLVLAHYPLIQRPFPFAWRWVVAFIAITLVTYGIVLFFPAPSRLKAVGESVRHTSRFIWHRSPASLATAAVVIAMALIGAWMVTYNLAYESFWQDELASISAATGVVHHGIPVWSTGFLYTKSELFSYMLAGLIAIFGYNPVALRMLSATEYVLVLLLTFYVARYFFGRRVGLLAMALMLCNPFVLHWGREARMYQQAQLMVLVVVFLFYKAIEPGARTRYIYLSMAAVVVMYLSHEESFIILPAILIYFLVTQRLTWIRNRHWWIAGLSAIACIAAQLIIWRMTRRPVLGTDRTVLFLLHFSPENISFYANMFFNPSLVGVAQEVMLQVAMVFAIIAAIIGVVRKDRYLRFFSLMVFLPLGVLSISLPLYDDRYVYMLLPSLFILDAVLVVRLLTAIGRAARRVTAPSAAIGITTVVAVLMCLLMLGSEISSLSNVGLAFSRAFGIAFHHSHPDYQYAGDYIRAHWEPGDVIIAAAPESDTAFYAEQPNYYLYQTKALSLFEDSGVVLTNNTGAQPIFNVNDLQEVLARYHRVWLLASAGHSGIVGNSGPSPVNQNFTLVFEGQATSVYLYTG